MRRRDFLRLTAAGAAGYVLGAVARSKPVSRELTGFHNGLTVPPGEVWQCTGLIESDANVVVEGTLVMRPGATLRFVGVNEEAFQGGDSDEPIASDIGLWVQHDGLLDACGTPKLGWARATDSLRAGATELDVDPDPVGWNAGDTLVITPTIPPSSEVPVNEAYDTVVVTAVDGRRVTLDQPLAYNHPIVNVGRGLRFGAEVLNMTRDVRIEGSPMGRTHTVFNHAHRPQHVCHVAFRHMGPTKHQGVEGAKGPIATPVLGRWPLHFHIMDEHSRGSLVEGCVTEDSGSFSFVAHRSHGVTFRDCIADRTSKHQYWWDAKNLDASVHFTNDTLFDRCVGSRRLNQPGSDSAQNQRDAAFDILRGEGNVIRDCVGVGGERAPQAAGVSWQASKGGRTTAGNWVFEGRTVLHNNGEDGSIVWENRQIGEKRNVAGLVAYHNAAHGFEHGAYRNNYSYTDIISYGNGQSGVNLKALSAGPDDAPEPQVWRDALFDGAGISRAALFIREHKTGATAFPVRFVRCEFRGGTFAQVEKSFHSNDRKSFDLLDFEHCTFGPEVRAFFMGQADSRTVWRVQDEAHGCIELRPVQTAGAVFDGTWEAWVKEIPFFAEE